MDPKPSFLLGNDAAGELIRRGALLVLSTIPCSLSPLVSRKQTSLFSDPQSLATLCLFTTSGPSPVELLAFWGFMVFSHAPIPRKGSGNNNNNSTIKWHHHRNLSGDYNSTIEQKLGLNYILMSGEQLHQSKINSLRALGEI